MVVTLLATVRLLRRMGRALADPATRGIVVLALITLLAGTIFYANVEGWSALDAAYFSVVTLTTIGYGDLAPGTDLGKVFTIAYSLTGIGIIAGFVTSLAVATRRHADPDSDPDSDPGADHGRGPQ